MKIVKIVLLIVLIAMSLAAGAAKVMRAPQEVQFFEAAGLSLQLLVLLGFGQIIGAALAAIPRLRKIGLGVMAVGFLVSAIAILMTGNVAFAAISVGPVILSVYLMARRAN